MDELTQPQNPFTNASISNRVFTTDGIVSYLKTSTGTHLRLSTKRLRSSYCLAISAWTGSHILKTLSRTPPFLTESLLQTGLLAIYKASTGTHLRLSTKRLRSSYWLAISAWTGSHNLKTLSWTPPFLTESVLQDGIISNLQSIYWHTPKIKYEKTKEFLLVSNFSMDRLTQPQNPFVNASISNRVGTINGIISYLQSRNLNSGQNTKKQNTTQWTNTV